MVQATLPASSSFCFPAEHQCSLKSLFTLSTPPEFMRTSLSLAAAATAVFVLLLLTAVEVEAIRLDAESRAAVNNNHQQQQVVVNKPIQNSVQKDAAPGTSGSSSGETTKRSVAGQEVRATAHKLPEFHEDYYGASVHQPRHH
ncbi:hypothetical protein BS78_04G308000 [Paspalum vaginatum]|nr:hypothetical protein BS78_04G308000 [Paspalum vaginatum]